MGQMLEKRRGVMEQGDRRVVWQGFGDGLTQAVEIAVTPILFAVLGLWLDRRVGTTPVFGVALAVFAMVGVFLRAWYHYVARVDALEKGKAWKRTR